MSGSTSTTGIALIPRSAARRQTTFCHELSRQAPFWDEVIAGIRQQNFMIDQAVNRLKMMSVHLTLDQPTIFENCSIAI